MESIPEINHRGSALGRSDSREERVTTTGRVVSAYQEGPRLAFWTLHDQSAEVQVALTPQRLGQVPFDAALMVTTGQVVQVAGVLNRSRRGALTITALVVAKS